MKQFAERLLMPLYARPARDPNAPYFADLYARAIAAAIDFSIIYVLFNAPFRWLTSYLYRNVDTALLGQAQQQTNNGVMFDMLWQSHLPFWWAVNAVIQILVMGMVIVGSQYIWATTPGKLLLGLRIVHYPSLQPPARWRYVLRFLGYIPSTGCLMIGVFWASFNRERRCWHDYIAGTAVINERPARWYWNKTKTLYAKLRARSAPVEQPVGEPPAKKGE